MANSPRRTLWIATVNASAKIRFRAVRLLCERVSPEDCTTLMDIASRCSQYAEAGDFASCFETDSLFHCEISERSGNAYLAELDRLLDYQVQLLHSIKKATKERMIENIALHIPIVKAICRKDARKAEEVMYEQVAGFYTSLRIHARCRCVHVLNFTASRPL